jgi:peptidoglycan/LPS O-acetylase OafA/YrhL
MAEVRRVEFIHAIRGIAPLLVIVAHLGGSGLVFVGAQWPIFDLWVNGVVLPLGLYQLGGHLGVVLFFLVSGYILSRVSLKETAGQFAIKRAFRLVPPMLIAYCLMVGASAIVKYNGAHSLIGMESDAPLDVLFSVLQLSWIIGTPYTLGVTWSLFVEISFYIAIAATIHLSRIRPLLATWLMLAYAAILIVPFELGAPAGPLYLDVILHLPILVAGRCLYFLHTGAERRPWLVCLVATWTIFLALSTIHVGKALWTGAQPPVLTYVYAMAIFVGLMLLNPRRLPAPISFVADISYSLYLFHMPVGSTILFFLYRQGIEFGWCFAAAVAGSIAAAWVGYVWVELPFIKSATSLTAASRKTAAASS